MGWLLLVGCVLVAYSLPLVLFVSTTALRPQLFVIATVAFFMWSVCFLLTTALWSALFSQQMQDEVWPLIMLAALLQEVTRLLFVKAYMSTAHLSTATYRSRRLPSPLRC